MRELGSDDSDDDSGDALRCRVRECGKAGDEHWLLHGTTWDKAERIIKDGFDHRSSNGGMHWMVQ